MEFHANEDIIELAKSINRMADSRTKPLDAIIEQLRAKLEEAYKNQAPLRTQLATAQEKNRDWAGQLAKEMKARAPLLEENDKLHDQIFTYEEAEALVCPEDVGFVEFIKSLRTRIEELEGENENYTLVMLRIDNYCRVNDIDITEAIKGE